MLGIVTHSVFDGARADMDAMFDMLPYRAQNAIIKNAHILGGDKGIVREIQQAIEAYSRYKGHKDFYAEHDVAGWAKQPDMFNDNKTPVDVYGENVINLVNLFDKAKTEKELNLRFKAYNKLVKGEDGLFPVEPIPKEDAFAEVFNKNNLYDGKFKIRDSEAVRSEPLPPTDGQGNREPSKGEQPSQERGVDKGEKKGTEKVEGRGVKKPRFAGEALGEKLPEEENKLITKSKTKKYHVIDDHIFNNDDLKDNWDFIQSIYMQKNNLLFSFQLSEEEFKRIKTPLLEHINQHKYVGNASKDYYDNIISVENIDYTGYTVNMVELFLLENDVVYEKLSEEEINQLIN